MPTSLTLFRRALGATLVAVVLAACSSGGSSTKPAGPAPLGEIITATNAADNGRITGDVTGTGGRKTPLLGVVHGDLKGTGELTAGLQLEDGTPVAVELRWIGGTLYVKRVAVSSDVSANNKTALLVWTLRSPTDRPWLKIPGISNILTQVLAPFVPAQLAALIKQANIPTETHTDGSLLRIHATKPFPFLGPWVKATPDLWVDKQNRIVRVQVTSTTGGTKYDVSYSGAPAAPTAPAASEIATSTTNVLKLTGPYASVRSGTTAGVQWSLLRAPATGGVECWRFQATPPVKSTMTTTPDGSWCALPPPPDADPADQVRFVAATAGTGTSDVLAATLPKGVKSIEITRIGGKPEPVAVDGSYFVWVGSPAPKVGFVEVTLAGGQKLACAPGSITTPRDYTTLEPDQIRRSLSSPWVCTEP